MPTKLPRSILWLAMVVLGLLLVADVAYFARGSLEMFPTPEQQDKVSGVTGILAVLLAAVEVGLWAIRERF